VPLDRSPALSASESCRPDSVATPSMGCPDDVATLIRQIVYSGGLVAGAMLSFQAAPQQPQSYRHVSDYKYSSISRRYSTASSWQSTVGSQAAPLRPVVLQQSILDGTATLIHGRQPQGPAPRGPCADNLTNSISEQPTKEPTGCQHKAATALPVGKVT
jgi:hypothetical protein